MRRRLLTLLNGRSPSAVEKRHQNISSALKELGWPQIVGYKPLANFRRDVLLPKLVVQLNARPKLHALAARAIELPAVAPAVASYHSVEMPAPNKAKRIEQSRAPFLVCVDNGTKRDYLAQEARNLSLGAAGEEFVLEFENWRLTKHGRQDLARKIEHVSLKRGDGLGFDISSFELDGSPRCIEVKTTAYAGETPFFVSSNEFRYSCAYPERFHLYRVFGFRKSPKIYDLPGRVDEHCFLDAVTFSATFS